MRGCGLVHLDLKPDNILRSKSGKWKLADFGLAVPEQGCGCDDITPGDCRYLSREVLQCDVTHLAKGDIFSLGIIAYEMATTPKPLPYNGAEWHALRDGNLDSSLLTELSAELRDFLCSLVQSDVAARPDCARVVEFCSPTPVHGSMAQTQRRQVAATESPEIARLRKENEELARLKEENEELRQQGLQQATAAAEEVARLQRENEALKRKLHGSRSQADELQAELMQSRQAASATPPHHVPYRAMLGGA